MDQNHCESDMEDDDGEDVKDEAMYGDGKTVNQFVQHVSMAEYQKQATEYTKTAVQDLMSSPEYQRVYTRCQLCWCSWSDGQFSTNCFECGGYAMNRSCPVCLGKCGSIWTRDVDMSHTNYEAHWDGDCLLPADERQGYLTQLLLSTETASELDLMDAMEDLATH